MAFSRPCARAGFDFFDWHIESRSTAARIALHIQVPRSAFVGLTYDNPPGSAKTCLNAKLASCKLTLKLPGQEPRIYTTNNCAAFEIPAERRDHGIAIVA